MRNEHPDPSGGLADWGAAQRQAPRWHPTNPQAARPARRNR
jgi:hypothetical protein